MIQQIQTEIEQLKRQLDVAVMAHSYQGQEILEVADAVGDSFQLSKQAQVCSQSRILLCGVHFMAETAKLLSPDKQVYLAHPGAVCPMAGQFTPEQIMAERAKHPGCKVVAYINTTAALKAVSDVCVTSSSAEQIVRNLDADEILFIPDCNLGSYVQSRVPEKKIYLLPGGCPVHASVEPEELSAARALYPEAEILVHPECRKEITAGADFAGATSAIMQYAKQSDRNAFIIGTEISITEHLQVDCPDKRFYNLSKKLICPDMKLTTLMDVLHTLRDISRGTAQEILIPAQIQQAAQRSIEAMLRLGA
ncbi:quinolinate synthase NadA [uncultured Ruminococcus sp.]|uniref:quinolinate synthase NadA n=1 Tax=uncultured Ruminococcus sp. TaxID=165186 RepID=UPI00260062DE|nr:quinolinate synthase NadA [uncultured Ruminococcus sp.]